ncbi:MAG: ATP-binding protein [Bacteroidota bacterium]
MKKILFLVFAVSISCKVQAQSNTHRLVKVWQTDSVVAVPESVLIDPKEKILYVSEIGPGNASAFDNNGAVGKVGLDGKIIDLNWVTGLHSPKGLARKGNELYVADLTELVVIDIKNAKIIKKYPIEGGGMLNDVTVNDKGVVYFSDSKTKKIHQVSNQQLSTFMENVSGVNGLKAIGNELYILGGKRFFKVDANKKETDIAQLPQGGDGLEPLGNGDFLATSWGGYIFYVSKDGKVETLLDSHNPRVNTADLAYDATKKILYVPSFYNKIITAYRLE